MICAILEKIGTLAVWKTPLLQYLKKWIAGILVTFKNYRSANVQERTLQEARESLREVIELVLLSNRELVEQQLSGKKEFYD
ncbi:hypothetical protein NUACC26_084820 [Scytonema sp. NUACC26]